VSSSVSTINIHVCLGLKHCRRWQPFAETCRGKIWNTLIKPTSSLTHLLVILHPQRLRIIMFRYMPNCCMFRQTCVATTRQAAYKSVRRKCDSRRGDVLSYLMVATQVCRNMQQCGKHKHTILQHCLSSLKGTYDSLKMTTTCRNMSG
jgi:hypothetical protein